LRFTHHTDFFTKTLFRIYSVVPFLHELRVLTDWTVSETSLDFFMWMKLEDAQHNLYRTHVDMEFRAEIPPGSKRGAFEKITQGLCVLSILLAILLGPLWYFSSLNPVVRENPVVFGELYVGLELWTNKGSQSKEESWRQSVTLYKAQAQNIIHKKSDDVTQLETMTEQIAEFPVASDSFWMISSSARERLKKDLGKGPDEMKLVVSYTFDRKATGVKATGRHAMACMNSTNFGRFVEALTAPDKTTQPDKALQKTLTINVSWPEALMLTSHSEIEVKKTDAKQ